MILPIYTYGTPVLRHKAKPVKEIDENIIRQIMDMFDTMRASDGIGLALLDKSDPPLISSVLANRVERITSSNLPHIL